MFLIEIDIVATEINQNKANNEYEAQEKRRFEGNIQSGRKPNNFMFFVKKCMNFERKKRKNICYKGIKRVSNV